MTSPITTAINVARSRLEAHPEPHNPSAEAERAIESLYRGAFRRTLSYILGAEPVFRRRYEDDAYFKMALDTMVKATIEATFHHDPDAASSLSAEQIEEMLPVLEPPEVDIPPIEDGQLWRDLYGRTIEIIDASEETLRVQWTPGGIAPSGMSRKNLRLCYTLVGAGS